MVAFVVAVVAVVGSNDDVPLLLLSLQALKEQEVLL
jgi:hypothetical protein